MTRLIFTGDVMLGRLVNDHLITVSDPSIIWGDTLEILKSADFTLINLEFALTRNKTPGKKDTPVFFFRSEPNHVKSLKKAGVDYCALSNNHVLDFGIKGLRETIRELDNASISHSGVGNNIQEARKPATLTREGLKINIFSISDNEPGWEAKKNKPGIFYLPIRLEDQRVKDFLKNIRRAEKEGCFVIVSAHWGPNMVRVPPQHHRSFAHAVIDEGAKVFYGHSAHVFQPIEIYKDSLILYDCGEMIDDYAVDPHLRNDESFLYEVYINKGSLVKIVLRPIIITNLQVNLARGGVGKNISNKMKNLSEKFGTSFQQNKEILSATIL